MPSGSASQSVVDALSRLSEANRARHSQRITNELTVLIATLTLYAATIWFVSVASPTLNPAQRYLIVAVLLGLAFAVYLYMWRWQSPMTVTKEWPSGQRMG